MSKVGELLEAISQAMAANAPVRPSKIIVTGGYSQLSCEQDFRNHTMLAPGGGGTLFQGIPIESTNETDKDFSYKIVFPENEA